MSSTSSFSNQQRNINVEDQTQDPYVHADLEECRKFLRENLPAIPEDEVDDLVTQAYKELRPEYRKTFFDVTILYAERDRDLVMAFEKNIMERVFLKDKPHKPVIYTLEKSTGPEGNQPVMKAIGNAIKNSVYLFIVLTDNLCSDGMAELAAHAALSDLMSNRDTMWSLVPCFTQPRREIEHDIPFGIGPLKGIQINEREQFTFKNIKDLLEARRSLYLSRVRMQKEQATEHMKDEITRRIKQKKIDRDRARRDLLAAYHAQVPDDYQPEPAPRPVHLPPSATAVAPGQQFINYTHYPAGQHVYVPQFIRVPGTVHIDAERVQIGDGNIVQTYRRGPEVPQPIVYRQAGTIPSTDSQGSNPTQANRGMADSSTSYASTGLYLGGQPSASQDARIQRDLEESTNSDSISLDPAPHVYGVDDMRTNSLRM